MAENICKASELKRSSLEIVTPTEPHSIPINWWPQKNILTPPNRGRDATLFFFRKDSKSFAAVFY